MAIKKNLLQIVQSIVSDLSDEEVSSINDTVEAEQVANIVEGIFYDLVAVRDIPEHEELIKLTAQSDSNYPTYFSVPDNVGRITCIWYDHSDDGTFDYKETFWRDPITFLTMVDGVQENYQNVTELSNGTNLRIRNNKHPEYYTSFDDHYIIFDSFKSTVDSTLQASKIRATAVKIPTFVKSDTYTPDLDENLFPRLINESRSMAQELMKGSTTRKVEQAARRQKFFMQNDKKNVAPNRREGPDYGRH